MISANWKPFYRFIKTQSQSPVALIWCWITLWRQQTIFWDIRDRQQISGPRLCAPFTVRWVHKSQMFLNTKHKHLCFLSVFNVLATFLLISINSYMHMNADKWKELIADAYQSMSSPLFSPHRLFTCRQPKPAQTWLVKLETETKGSKGPKFLSLA